MDAVHRTPLRGGRLPGLPARGILAGRAPHSLRTNNDSQDKDMRLPIRVALWLPGLLLVVLPLSAQQVRPASTGSHAAVPRSAAGSITPAEIDGDLRFLS